MKMTWIFYFTIFVFITFCESENITLLSTNGYVYVKESYNLSIQCQSNITGNISSIFFVPGNNIGGSLTLFVIPSSNTCYVNPPYTSQCNSTSNSFTLFVPPDKYYNNQTWRCEGIVDGVNIGSSKTALVVVFVPSSSVGIQNATPTNRLLGTEGQDVTVSCVAVGGKPPPSITLKVDGTTLATGIQSVTYTFKAISRSYDRKTVTCQVINGDSFNNPNSDSKLFYLYLKPLQPMFSPNPVSTEETRQLVVSCTSTGSRPAATFQWFIDQATITTGITTTPVYNNADDTYTVTSTLTYIVNRTYNGQNIACVAYNNVSTTGVQTISTLDVKFAPEITVHNVTYDQNTATRTVACIIVGNPTTYTYNKWQHRSTHGLLIRELDGGQDGVLTLPNVRVDTRYQDSGVYLCTAANGIRDRDGKLEQIGSGYVSVKAQPVISSETKETEYGELEKYKDIYVNVYSSPKYTTLKWYKSSTQISQNDKYTMSETAALVTGIFHGTEIQLDGYRVKVTIKNLTEADCYVSYRVELSNGIGLTVMHSIILECGSRPQTPVNFTVPSSSDSSILLQWEAGFNGGHEQIFYIEYRGFGCNTWELVQIPNSQQTGRQTYTLTDINDDTLYELRMYAENKINKSLPTETKIIKTTKESKMSASECAVAGVAGGLSAVILIQCIIIVVLLKLLLHEREKQKSKSDSSRWKDLTSYHNQMNCTVTDEQEVTLEENKNKQIIPGTAQDYETLGVTDNPNTYSELVSQEGLIFRSAQDYEKLGIRDNANIYSELVSHQDKRQSKRTAKHYE